MEVEEDIETDGVRSTDIDTSQTNVAIPNIPLECKNTLQAGFGFTPETSQFRIVSEDDRGAFGGNSVESFDHENVEEKSKKDERNNRTDNQEDAFSSIFENLNISSNSTDNANGSAVQLNETQEIEIDTIIPKEVQEKLLSKPPENVSEDFADYADMSPKQLPTEPTMTCLCMIPLGRKKPDHKHKILIPHDNADKPEGDDFGAYLCTFKDHRKDGSVYYRHFLVDVDTDGPADQMKIDNNDELVLLNENFVPECTHKAVMDLFRNVKVDGKTRFTLVIRRVQHSQAKKKWEWIETSAILAPHNQTEDYPVVERVKFHPLRDERIEVPKSQHLYKVPGTQQYLDICDGKVSIDTLKHDASDRTKIIWKRAQYWQDNVDEIHINFAAALCDEAMKWYIGVDGNKIVLKNEPVWFKMIKVGEKIRFQFDNQYLGYDLKSGEVKPEISQCVFAELPASSINTDAPPRHSEDSGLEILERMSEASSLESRHSSTASSLSSLHSDRRSVASSQTSVDSDKRSIASSQTSVDSDKRSVASSQTSVDSDKRSIASSQTSVDSDKRSVASSQTSVESDRSSVLSSQVSTDSGGIFVESCGELSSQTSETSDYKSDNNFVEEYKDVCKPKNILLNKSEDKPETQRHDKSEISSTS